MTNPEEMLSRLFNGWVNRWAIIFSFREAAEAGLPYAAQVIAATRARWAKELVTDPQWDKIFSDKAAFLKEGGVEHLIREGTRLALENARQSVDAASIVFAHSILDDMAFDCCRIIAAVDPKEVESRVEKGQVSLQEFRDRGYDAVRDDLLARLLEKLERESLLAKVDFIYQFCRPPEKWSPMTDYQYDRDRLVRFDKTRQDIVHRGVLSMHPNILEELDYMNRMGMHFIGLINHRYGLKIDPLIAAGLSKTPPTNQ